MIVKARDLPIRSQMIAMFLVVILPVFLASVFLLINMRTLTKNASLETALAYADNIKYRISDTVNSVESTVTKIASDRGINSFLSNEFENSAEYYDFYNSFSLSKTYNTSGQLDNIYVYVPRKDFIFSNEFRYTNDLITSQRWYRNAVASNGGFVWDIVLSPADNEYHLTCLKTVMHNSKVIGIVAAMVSSDWIDRIISDDDYSVVLSVDKGAVYFSNYDKIMVGDLIEPESDFRASSIRTVYDYGFWGFAGYTALENFYSSISFQIVILVPSALVNYEINRLSVVYGSFCGLLIVLSMLTIILFASVFSRRIRLLSEKMHAVAGGNFDVEINDEGKDEISTLYTDLDQMITDMKQLIDDNYRVKLQGEAFKFNQMEAEFKALASQINPHFLYNTLETIRMKAYCNNDKETANLVKKLGKFMRRCLEFKDGEVTLRSELEFTNSYLELQSARFGDRVSYSIYSEVAKDYMILPLLIQPIVENAFVHGIEGNKSNGRIDIKVYYHGKYVMVDVTDNGQGISEEKLRELEAKLELSDTSSGKSIGLTNVHKRIKMYHGEEYGMSISSTEGKGTTIRLTLPREPQTGLFAKRDDMLQKKAAVKGR